MLKIFEVGVLDKNFPKRISIKIKLKLTYLSQL